MSTQTKTSDTEYRLHPQPDLKIQAQIIGLLSVLMIFKLI